MPEEVSSLIRRFDALVEQVRVLQQQVDTLKEQVADLSGVRRLVSADEPSAKEAIPVVPMRTSADEAENVSTANLLSNLATLCFVLVVALILRMLADHHIVDRRVGAGLGLAYAAALIAYGFHRFARCRRLIPIYALSGVILAFTVVYETYERFAVLTSMAAHGLLALAMIAMFAMSLRFSIALPLYVGVIGAGTTAMMLGFPNLDFLSTGLFLVLVNATAFAGRRVPRGREVIWPAVLLSLGYWGIWIVKLRTPFGRGEALSENLAPQCFLPLLSIFAAMYIVMVLWSVNVDGWDHALLEGVLPILNVLFAYGAAYATAEVLGVERSAIAVVGSAVAVAHMLLAVAVARRKGRPRKPTTTFTVAAVILLGVALPDAIGHVALVLLAWSAVAFATAVISFVRENRLARVTAYAFQVFVCLFAARHDVFAVESMATAGTALLALALLGISMGHYAWCRRRALRPETPLFRFAAVLLVLTCAMYGFYFARTGLTLVAGSGVLSGSGFHAAQSVLINGGALLLLLVGLWRRNGEVVAAGFLATMLGALKVFGFDLTHIKDLPLVLSLTVFGLTAAGASLIWRRWQREVQGLP